MLDPNRPSAMSLPELELEELERLLKRRDEIQKMLGEDAETQAGNVAKISPAKAKTSRFPYSDPASRSKKKKSARLRRRPSGRR
jgi:hypothetical protein